MRNDIALSKTQGTRVDESGQVNCHSETNDLLRKVGFSHHLETLGAGSPKAPNLNVLL